jgi:hypothetical protein
MIKGVTWIEDRPWKGTSMRNLIIGVVTTLAMIGIGAAPDRAAAAEGAQPPKSSSKDSGGLSAAAGGSQERWVRLFNGRNLDGWYTFLQKHGKNNDPDRVIAIEDGTIHLYKDAADKSQVVMGYIGTEKEYGDYHFRLQYRWGPKKFEPRYKLKPDAGLYYHIIGPDAVWPRALQCQIEQTNVGDLIALYGLTVDTWIDPGTRGESMPTYQDPKAGGEARVLGGKGIAYQKHLAGSFELDGWNTLEVIARADTLVHILNGHVVNQGRNVRLVDPEKPGTSRPITRGRIALEVEAAEIYYRNVELRMLD